MPASWRDGLVNAFPVPQNPVKSHKSPKKQNKITPADQVKLHEGSSRRIEKKTTIITDVDEDADNTALIGDPFPFFQLPAEIRNRIYRLVLFSAPGYRDADGRKKSRTSILATSKRMHQEASYVLYSSSSFRIFPLQDFAPVPVIQQLRPMYRTMVTKLEMVVGSSWTSPPKTWRVSKLLAKRLGKLSSVQTLKIFVELDPSLPMFDKYRISPTFYTDFCGDLLRDVLATMPHLKAVEMDGNPGVDTTGPLVSRLLHEVEQKGKSCTLGSTKPMTSAAGAQPVFWQ